MMYLGGRDFFIMTESLLSLLNDLISLLEKNKNHVEKYHNAVIWHVDKQIILCIGKPMLMCHPRIFAKMTQNIFCRYD